MSVSAIIRHGFACTLGLFAWWYFYSVESIFYPEWVGVVVAAFIITMVVLIISNNLFLSIIIIVLYHLAFTPNVVLALQDSLPVLGGMAGGTALWKIL